MPASRSLPDLTLASQLTTPCEPACGRRLRFVLWLTMPASEARRRRLRAEAWLTMPGERSLLTTPASQPG
jgi:hypothetical protein